MPSNRDPTTPRRSQGGAVKPTALKPRDPDATAAALRSRNTSTSHKVGSSLSSLLQSRSEFASAKRQQVATPASPLPDIDSKDAHNPLAECAYAQDIYCYYRRVEPRFAVPADYMTSQVRARVKGGQGCLLQPWTLDGL